jgi:hypothetical protein
MTFADLLTTLATRGALPASRVKDCRTSMRYLAHALGQPGLDQASVEGTCRDPATWTDALETHFQALEAQGRTISAVTRRNSRNNLRLVFRMAEASGLLPTPLPLRLLTLPSRTLWRRQHYATTPYQTTYRNQNGPRCFALPRAQWPPEIQDGWRTYQAKCGLRLREPTLRAYARNLEVYLGYLTHICGRTPGWADVFDVAQLTEFVRWHGARLARPVSTQGQCVVIAIAAMAGVLEHPARPALAHLRTTLPMPAPLHTKREHWVSLAQVEAVAEACLVEGRAPLVPHRHQGEHRGSLRATRFQRGLILKLLVRIPLRQRNVREMQLGTNLYEDQGHWHLHFSGSELKVGERRGRINTYHVDLTDYCPDLLPVLTEFLQVYRPRLPGAAASKLCFLTRRGRPFTDIGLRAELASTVAMRTGQRFYPHLIRTIWATEYLKATQDFTTAATMLGDTLPVVMRTYYEIVHEDQHAKAKAFLSTALQG